jgi:hypothetical protein
MAWFGPRWMKVYNIDPVPRSMDARILIGLAFATVTWLFGELQYLLHDMPYGVISGIQLAVLLGLLSPVRRSWQFQNFRPWKISAYPSRLVIPILLLTGLAALNWSRLRWWSLLVVPGYLVGDALGGLIGSWIRHWVLAMKDVWNIARSMGPPIGGFALGYVVIAFIFAGLFASVWRTDARAFAGLQDRPTFVDFTYYSVMTISITGYGDVAPRAPVAKVLASAEALVGLGWTIVVFAAVLTVVQRKLDPKPGATGANEGQQGS